MAKHIATQQADMGEVDKPKIIHAVNAIEASGKPLSPQGLGLWLTKHRGEVVDGKRFACEEDAHTKQKRWFVESAGLKG